MSVAEARERIAARVALDLAPGEVVNLGIGLPTEVARHLPGPDGPDGRGGGPAEPVWLHAENGMVGMGPDAPPGAEDPDRIDAGGRYVGVAPGGAYLDSVTAFALVRNGRVRTCVLGAFEVDVHGDLANWRVPGRTSPGVGGGMELAQRVPRVIVATLHRDKAGGAKLVGRCRLPRTARGVVQRIVTELAVLAPAGDRFDVLELAPGVEAADVRAATDAPVAFDRVRPWGGAAAPEEGATIP